MAASALCVRPADCLGGNPFFGAHRGVRPAPAPRRPAPQQQQQQQRYVQVGTTGSTSVPGQSRPARGRANGRKRGRRSPRATGSPAAQKRVMENVVILKRGEQNRQAKVTAAPELAAPQAEKARTTADQVQHGPQVEKGEPVPAAKQGGEHVQNVEPVAAAADTHAKKAEAAEQQRGADTTTNATKAKVVAPSDRHVPQAKEKDNKKNVPVAAAATKQSGGKGMKAGAAPPALYSGPSFAAAPEPRMLPIPFLLLKGRGARLRPRDAERAAPTA